MTLVLHDTATGSRRPLASREPGVVSMYVCGPTVYAPPHIGHGRFALVFDVLRRYLTWCGYEVVHCSNITDVDDKIIARAHDEHRSEADLAAEFEDAWFETMAKLNVQRPTHVPHATAYVPKMISMIEDLVARGAAYEAPDGVYLSVDDVPGYGLLTPQSLSDLKIGARVSNSSAKRSPLDFALWKKSNGSDGITWASPWGDGRPGWHTECVVMSLDLLGDGFDLHGGGLDLRFPHHENERAQAVALGRRFAQHWMHNGFIEVDDKKMGKSEGNAMPIAELLESHDARSYRLLVLQCHYRSPVQVTAGTLAEGDRSLARLDTYLKRAETLPVADVDEHLITEFRLRMDDDLDTPGAMALLFSAIRTANSLVDEGRLQDAAALHAGIDQILIAVGLGTGEMSPIEVMPHEVKDLLDQRQRARERRSWPCADALRAQIEALGWEVCDTTAGQTARPTM